jgi:hypothetical protein
VESDILALLMSLKAEDGYIKHRISRDVYYSPMGHCFLNKWLFPDRAVSIGVYEDVMHHKYDSISVDFYSTHEEALTPAEKELSKIGRKAQRSSDQKRREHYLTYELPKTSFIKDVKGSLLPFVRAYLKVYGHKEP